MNGGERCATCGRLSTRQREWKYDELCRCYRSGGWIMQYMGEGKRKFTCRQCVAAIQERVAMEARAGALVLERVMAEIKKQLDAEAFAASLEAYKKIYG